MFKFLIIIFFSSTAAITNAQQVSILLDRADILIGQPINMAVKIPLNASDENVKFFVPDSILHFDVISTSALKHSSGSVHKEFIITSFDSGSFTFPSFKVVVNNQELYTPPVLINIGYSKEDGPGLKDIKPPRHVRPQNYLWLKILAALFSLLLIYLLLKKLFKKKNQVKDSSDFFSDIKIKLEKLKLLTNEPKQFHLKLSEVLRKYLEGEFKEGMMMKTSGEVLNYLNSKNFSKGDVLKLEYALRAGDAVKYAGYETSNEKNIGYLKTVEDFIVSTHQQYEKQKL